MNTKTIISTKEISELVGITHKAVLKDVRQLINDNNAHFDYMIEYDNDKGLCILLDKQLTELLIGKYRTEDANAVMTKFKEIENKNNSKTLENLFTSMSNSEYETLITNVCKLVEDKENLYNKEFLINLFKMNK